ncbi:MAG: ribonuclease H-like domain-containing protein [Candidatus Methanomethylophilaceae archaeon]|jgi:uncharacterized protein YprB with RNaseH-like and TPR domain
MIKRTFCIAPSIGKKKEMCIWESGIRNWEEFLDAEEVCTVPVYRKGDCDRAISKAADLLKNRDSVGLGKITPKSEKWRMFGEFGDEAAYLDIETDGLSRDSLVTAVTVHRKNRTVTLVHGRELNSRNLSDALNGSTMLVTFNGSCFDIPILKNSFPSLDFEMPHLDLRFAARRVGFSGGLGRLETELGIERAEEIEGVDGFEAVRLWKRWEMYNDADALDKLVEYNRADTVNLERIAEIVYPKLVRDYAGFIW